MAVFTSGREIYGLKVNVRKIISNNNLGQTATRACDLTLKASICRNASRGGQLQQRWCGSSYATAEEAIFRNPWRGGKLYRRDSHSWDTSVEKAICRNPIWRENLIYLLLCYSLWNYKVIYRNKFIYSFIARQKTFLPGGSEHPV